MTAGEWLVEALAWAALGTWWQRNPCGAAPVRESPRGRRQAIAPDPDRALYVFMIWLPIDLWDRVRREHRRRREALS
jgi:hypothetical protein